MKKGIFFLIFLCFVVNLWAQSEESANDGFRVRVGALFAPQGRLELRNPKGGTSVIMPLQGYFSFSYEESTLYTMYNFSATEIGVLYAYNIPKTFVNVYTVSTCSLLSKGGYVGVGVNSSSFRGAGIVLAEVGTTQQKWEPTLYIGVGILFSKIIY